MCTLCRAWVLFNILYLVTYSKLVTVFIHFSVYFRTTYSAEQHIYHILEELQYVLDKC